MHIEKYKFIHNIIIMLGHHEGLEIGIKYKIYL